MRGNHLAYAATQGTLLKYREPPFLNSSLPCVLIEELIDTRIELIMIELNHGTLKLQKGLLHY